MIRLTIVGEPCAQGRPRATIRGGRPHVYDPAPSRSWKGQARTQMAAALDGVGMIAEGPVAVTIRAYHACPKGDRRKTKPAPLRWRSKRPDIDQIAKAVLDAATSVLWLDDAQVASLTVQQFTAAQDEMPRVEIEVSELPRAVAPEES